MRYYFDTEFNENVRPIDLISIGVVNNEGKELYIINEQFAFFDAYKISSDKESFQYLNSCNDWVKTNVLPILFSTAPNGDENLSMTGNMQGIKNALVDFVANDPYPEFWAYYGHYDWYLITRMFGSFDKMPKNWPQACYDLHQFAKHHGMSRKLPKKLEPEHNALVDARWTKQAFDFVQSTSGKVIKWP